MAETAPALSEDLAPPAADARRRPRFGCGTVTLTRVSLPAAERTYFAWVHDLSETGIGLDVLGPLSAGLHITFELKRDDGSRKVRLRAEVVHATRVGTFYRLGCKFLKPLRPWVLAAVLRQTHDR